MNVQTEVLMTRMAAVPSMLLAVLLAGTTACSDSSGPKEGTPPILPSLPGLVVSAPVQFGAVQGSLAASAAGPVSAGVTYVSLAPGSVPDGQLATIRNRATAQFVIAAVVNGGFDPVAIVASVGDTLAIEITRTGSVAPLAAVEVVRAARPPVVVRTDPPRKQVDVPLNAIIVIVFSTPIDATTLTTESVQLWRGATLVAGTVRFSDPEHLRAEFRPDSLLAGQTAYRLVVTPGIRDVNGVALASQLDGEFTTGDTEQVAARLAFPRGPGAADVGQPFTVQVTIEDALGNRVLSATDPVTLALDANPGAATLAGTLTVVPTEGVATFSDLRIDRRGNGYTLAATADTLAGAVSWPFPVGDLVFASVSVGGYHVCGVTTAGAAYCWGSNQWGGLGDGTYIGDGALTPVPVAGGLTFASVSAGHGLNCGVTTAGAAYCWGYPGILGDGSNDGIASYTPVPVAGGLTFASVSAEGYHACGVTTAGTAYCWGDNSYGKLGVGSATAVNTPTKVVGGLTFASVSAGLGHSCGVTTTGVAYCWGLNALGELGTGTSTGSTIPVPVAGGLTFATVSAGGYGTCGATTSGAVYCWGSNLYGLLGNDPSTGSEWCAFDFSYGGDWGPGGAFCSRVPVSVPGGLNLASLSASGEDLGACGLTSTGVAYCWGYLANLGQYDGAAPPVAVAGGHTFAMLSTGWTSTCGVTTAGVAYCWGSNYDGLGDGTRNSSSVPVKVAGQP